MTDIEKFVNSFNFDRLYIFLKTKYFKKNVIIFYFDSFYIFLKT